MLLRKLLQEVEAVSELPECSGEPVPEGATVVGKLDDDHQRFYALRELLVIQICEAIAACEHLKIDMLAAATGKRREEPSEEAIQALQQATANIAQLKSRHKLMNQLFWASVKELFPELADKDVVHVCADWQVCWEDGENDLVQELFSLFGIV